MPTEEFLGFLDRRTGKPVGVKGARRSAGGIGGDGYDLVDAGGETYRADDADDLHAVLDGKTPSYNQTPQRPGLGAYDPGDLVPARVRVSTTWEAVDLEDERTPFFEKLLERRVPATVALRYVPALSGLVERGELCVLLVGTPRETGREPLSLVGRRVGSGYEEYPTKRTVLAAVPAPEELADPTGPGEPVLLVCMDGDAPSRARPADLRQASAEAWEGVAASPKP